MIIGGIFMTKALIAIPVYNEAQHAQNVLTAVQKYGSDVLVVDDGSTDATPAIVQAIPNLHLVRHEKNRGYGAALISAFRYFLEHDYDALVTMDCDGQHEPKRIPLLLEAIDQADIVSASRYLRDFQQNTLTPEDRRYVNMVITQELNQRFGLNLTDSFCGFKAYRRSLIEKLHITETGWGMPLQLWVQAARLGAKIIEIGVPRLYLDPNRAFGGVLNDTQTRLAYYRKVIAEAASVSVASPLADFQGCPV